METVQNSNNPQNSMDIDRALMGMCLLLQPFWLCLYLLLLGV